jgi:hypothetical protein
LRERGNNFSRLRNAYDTLPNNNQKDLSTMTGLRKFVQLIDAFTDTSGRVLAWLALAMALLTTLVVAMRYGFNTGSTCSCSAAPTP